MKWCMTKCIATQANSGDKLRIVLKIDWSAGVDQRTIPIPTSIIAQQAHMNTWPPENAVADERLELAVGIAGIDGTEDGFCFIAPPPLFQAGHAHKDQ